MTVQELINILQRCDPEAEVRIEHTYLNMTAALEVELTGPEVGSYIPYFHADDWE
jgi:hypothetical protein